MSETNSAPNLLELMGVGDNELAQVENKAEGEKRITPGMPELIRACGEEGIVLLENDGTLPLQKDEEVAVFGRVQQDYFYVGYGSGGDVHAPYLISLHEGLQNAGFQVNQDLKAVYETWCKDHPADHGVWGKWPYFHPEMPLSDESVVRAAKQSKVALVIIGRAAGEDRENTLEPGSYYLTDLEKDMLAKVNQHFEKKVLVIDAGNIMDVSFIKDYDFSAVVFGWQLGQESGNALANVLSGAANPSGRLSATIAWKYEDYPSTAYFGGVDENVYTEDIFVGYRYFETFAKDKVQYPFGYGLSYTSFSVEVRELVRDEDQVSVAVRVTNTGKRSGKEVVQLYVSQPKGKLSKAALVLAGFAKTKELAPAESEEIMITVNQKDLASFDEDGRSGYEKSFVLEAGEYTYYLGKNIRDLVACGSVTLAETIQVQQCKSVMAVDDAKPFAIMQEDGQLADVYASGRDLKDRILSNLPKEIATTGDQGIRLSDVAEGKHSLEEFIAQLSDKDLSDLSHGEGPMDSKFGTAGNAGMFGGITPELREKGVPTLITCDGPAGLRLRRYTSLLPCGTALACTWNTDLVEQLYAKEAEEMAYFHVDVLLAPGMNIHRNPLCGRNFEYYAEDPLLSGKMAAAAVRGIQSKGASACPKHFACNHQEVNRNHNDSRLSERALREIYLKNFEICIKESAPMNIMTSYNKVNGVWSHYNYDLATTVLRGEWGYEGNVVTDWWMQHDESPEFAGVKDSAYRVRAQVDVLMPGNWKFEETDYMFDEAQLETLGQPEGLTRAELQRTAANVLRFALKRLS